MELSKFDLTTFDCVSNGAGQGYSTGGPRSEPDLLMVESGSFQNYA